MQNITKQSDLGRFFTKLSKKLRSGDLFHGRIRFNQHKVSKTEAIGTLFHAGFDLLTEKDKDGHWHFTLKKIGKPGALEEINQARQLIFKQKRVGRAGMLINIFKIRTMYPMAHKAQEYLYKSQNTGPHGKISNDFRITKVGKHLRRYWIDELLQFINIIKGEMKLVGLRALSEGFFKTLPKQLQIERLKHKPALMGVTYADQPKNLAERIQSELKYIAFKKKYPLLADSVYFFKILWAIIFKGQRGY